MRKWTVKIKGNKYYLYNYSILVTEITKSQYNEFKSKAQPKELRELDRRIGV